MFNIFFSTLFLCIITKPIVCSNLYNTYQNDNVDHFAFDCLRYYIPRSMHSYSDLWIGDFLNIEYCIRPIKEKALMPDWLHTRDERFTFEQLRRLNVTTADLLSWSSTIDLAEKYQFFLDKKDFSSLSSELSYLKCQKPWFGSQCEYSFEMYESDDQNMLLDQAFLIKQSYGSNKNLNDRTCYTDIQCDRGGTSMCLDWREVCNGRIDCLNEGVDEKECFQLERNECAENEYRCHNGLCISIDISDKEEYRTDCLDRSGTTSLDDDYTECLKDPSFMCEEYACHPGKEQFPCGDGQCVEDFDVCANGRHYLLIESMNVQGNLSEECWLAFICLTKIKDGTEKKSCQKFVNASTLFASAQTCDSVTQFPTIPVLFGHVSFLYDRINTKMINMEAVFPPNYVCYNQQLCDFLQPTFRVDNKACRMGHQMGLKSNVSHRTWKSLIDAIKPSFQGCLTTAKKEMNIEHSSLYCCKNYSKCISKHRILDGISDCYLNDDEEQFQLSCAMNNSGRFRCYPYHNICYSPLIPKDICPPIVYSSKPPSYIYIAFHEICDRIVHLSPETINGENHTDETECQHWPCSNVYTRCNLFWNCENGQDEENCPQSICRFPSHPCVSPHNGTFLCLAVEIINNGIIDCLGGSDELQQCLEMETISPSAGRYHCFNENRCLTIADACYPPDPCSSVEDERFCKNRPTNCKSHMLINRSDIEIAFCQLDNLERILFSLEGALFYPRTQQRMIDHINNERSEVSIMTKNIIRATDDPDSAWSWQCNRGLYARVWLGGDNYTAKCFCPPSYYGDLCEYQNERVSLSLRLIANNNDGIYVIVVSLIDDHNAREVNSYEQIHYLVQEDRCLMSHDVYLLYSNRLKNNTKKYHVHIDAFDKISLTYLASWYLPIPFLFLPVNRLSVQLVVPADRITNSKKCLLHCEYGQCIEYLNVGKYFCQCLRGWSGIHCSIPSNCDDCSLDSICIGAIRNRSICVCPLNKFGSRCLLKDICRPDSCRNNGRCIVRSATSNRYVCICPTPFYGPTCRNKYTHKLEISLQTLQISKYIFVCFISPEFGRPNCQGQRLKMFQNVFILYHNYAFEILIVKMNDNYYLAAVQLHRKVNLSTSISADQRCASINETLDSAIVVLSPIRRAKFYHTICQTHHNLWCFFDESYMCLCTQERHANCFPFEHTEYMGMQMCRYQFHCLNEGTCFQDDPSCPKVTLCVCKDCFFGNRCQFYAQGIGLTLDDILRYEIRPNVTLTNQPLSIKVSAVLTMIMLGFSLINSCLALLVFTHKDCRKVGCGIYLLASSFTSLLTLITLTLKYWFLVLTQISIIPNRSILRAECVFIESFLKFFLYFDSWLNACVAIERSITVSQGINFNARKSQRIARCVIFLLPIVILGTVIPEFLYRDLFDDIEEERIWCVTHYSDFVQIYNKIISFFHFLGPFLFNLYSALFIICQASRQRATVRTQQSYKQHLYEQLNQHKQLIISPILLVILSLPRLIFSLLSSCVKAFHSPWLYITGYFISFAPSVLIFVMFVVPSETYKNLFKESIKKFLRRIHR